MGTLFGSELTAAVAGAAGCIRCRMELHAIDERRRCRRAPARRVCRTIWGSGVEIRTTAAGAGREQPIHAARRGRR